MTDLFDNSSPEEDFSLFQPEPKNKDNVDTSSSMNNLMAQAAIINGEDPVTTFQSISALPPEEKKVALEAISRKAKETENSASLDIVSTLIQDPSLDDETKANMLRAYQGEAIKPYDSLVGTAEVLHAQTKGEELETEERRLADVGSLINPIMEEVRLQQEAVTALAYDEEGDAVSLANNFGDLAELLIMLNEQVYAAQIRYAVDTGEVSTIEELVNFALLGEGKIDLREKYERFTAEERKDFLERSFRIFNNAKTFNLLNDNDLIQLDNFMAVSDPDYYTSTDRMLDNAGSVLDLIPGVSLLYRAVKGVYKSSKMTDVLRKVGLRRQASKKQPASVVSLAEQVNPEAARDMSKNINDDVTGEAAEVLAGTTRTEAVVEMTSPQVKTPDGSVKSKPYAIDRDILEAAYHESSRLERTPQEKLWAIDKIEKDLGKVEKLARYDEGSTSPTLKDNGSLDISEMYVAREGAFTSPQEAISTALRQLEYYGVKEENLTVMRKQGTDFVPTTAKEAKAKDVIRETATKGEFKPAPKKVLEEVKRTFIKEKKAAVIADRTGNWPPGKKEETLATLEKGEVPKIFEQELKDLQDSKGTRSKPTATERTLPDELKKANMQDEYAVKVDFNYQPKAIDIVKREDLDVKLNFLDRLSSKAPVPGKATASRYIFQVAHMLDKNIAQASVAAVDRGNRLQKVIMDKFDKGVLQPLSQLDDARAERISKIMHEQNMARRNYRIEELDQMGVNSDIELTILDNWKYMNDQLWHLSNMDMSRTLREKGFSMYKDVDADSLYIGKVLPRNLPHSQRPSTVYDPVVGKTKLTSDSWGKWEAEGAEIFHLKEPQIIDDVEVSYIVVRKGDGKKYIKAVQDDDTVLPYIEGWSHIDYKDPYFIERVMVDATGKEIGSTRQAIMTSPESKSADMAVEMLRKNASNALKGRTWKYISRNSRDIDPTEIALKKFEVASSAGLTSQRHRGQTLKQFDSSRTGDMSPHIADPLDSFKSSVAELSRRVPLREFLDDFEARILTKYGKVLPKDEWGQPKIPNADEKFIGSDVLKTKENKMMADAKAMIEHYNYMKFGYYNGIDAGWKSAINSISKVAGSVSRRLEKGVHAIGEEIPSLIGAFKGTAFNAHIALSAPPSQWMVQGLPALMNALLHPRYVMNFGSDGMVADMRKLVIGITKEGDDADLIEMMGKEKASEIIKLKKEWDKTGLAVGVDKHLLVENGLESMMPTHSKLEKIKKPYNWLVDKGREIGFDKGETFQLMAYWLAARNDAIKSGKSMDNAADFDAVRAKARTMTMNMNKAGEMPWNKDSLSLWTQFMISPYKALTMVGTRGLTMEERLKILAWQTLVMPLPSTISYQLRAAVGVEGTEGDAATELLTNGLLGGGINYLANQAFDEMGSASWQRNVQVDPEFAGVFTLAQAMAEDLSGVNMMQALAQSSPALSMVEGYNPIVKNLYTSFGKLLTAPLQETKEDEWYYLKAFAGENGALWQYSALTRGMSTALKEIMVDGAAKRYSALTGKVQDEDVTFMESLARGLFGLETSWQTIARRANTELYLANKDMRDDVDLWLKELEREATVQGFNMDDPRRAPYILRHISAFFPEGRMPPKMASYVMKQLRPDMTLSQKLLSAAGYGVEERETFYRAMGNATEEIQTMREWDESNRRVGEVE